MSEPKETSEIPNPLILKGNTGETRLKEVTIGVTTLETI